MAYKAQAYIPSSKVKTAEKAAKDKMGLYDAYTRTPYKVGAGGNSQEINFWQKQYDKAATNAPSQRFKYSNQAAYNKALNNVANRKAFTYDLSDDQLFQQAKDNYQAMGKAAMADTIGQASAMTGGYGNSYATSAGAQAYNNYLQELNNSIGDYYAMALNAYNSESDRLQGVYSALSSDRAAQQSEWQGDWGVTQNLMKLYSGNLGDARNRDVSLYGQRGDNLYKNAALYNDYYNTASGNDISVWDKTQGHNATQASQEHAEDIDRQQLQLQREQLAEPRRSNDLNYAAKLAPAYSKGSSGSSTKSKENTVNQLKYKIKKYKQKLNKDPSLRSKIPGTNMPKNEQLMGQYVERLLTGLPKDKKLDRKTEMELYSYGSFKA